ncbi:MULTISPECIES: AAA family ATPase [unclassified Leptolyngbya]|uniref:AAA family ATPase n=1 Tax=unclassified Leptolyngbya TaxID=2650499 RepID=UPI0016893A5F|nr:MULTISPECIES: AAA family ATPase [unclassified Leptolyngbya]MBD1909458.1 tetratricopeptide repeat protein [Leptolyngbya sp. FACHB-8]MBD2155645.1 tetratricopeptide repeat protein [Leptolyngbya sp. FACHB-16]
MTADEAIALLHQILNQSGQTAQLNDTQLKVFRQIWQGQSYPMIAQASGYDYDYIKQVSSRLWQMLSKALNQPVSKRNLQSVFQQYLQTVEPVAVSPSFLGQRSIYHNLRAGSDSAFIGREAEIERLLAFLSFDHPASCVSIEGLGGIGKTTLALAIAHHLKAASAPFNAIIFTSAKPNHLTSSGLLPRLQPDRTLQDLFRAIAYTLHCPDVLLQPFEEQLTQIYHQLSRQPTLLILDNLETVEEQVAILSFLHDLPSTTKTLLTSRAKTPFPSVTLAPLPPACGVDLIQSQSHNKGLRLTDNEAQQLHQRTSGIPAAIIYAVGQLASGYPWESSVQAVVQGDYARFYFESSLMALRDEPIYSLFLAAALFPSSAATDALAYVAELADPATVTQGLARLQQLSLLNGREGRFDMLPLTREYAIAQLNADPDLKLRQHQRRVEWYLTFAETYGGKDWTDWQNYGPLEQEWENLQDVIEWCIAGDRYEEVCRFWRKARCYSHAQGYSKNRLSCWATRLDWTNWLIQAAEQRQDWPTVAEVVFDRAWTLTLLGQPHHLESAKDLFARAWDYHLYLQPATQVELATHIAVWHIENLDFVEALHWLQRAEMMVQETELEATAYQRFSIRRHYYRGEIAYKTEDFTQAQAHFEQALQQAQQIDWRRVVFLTKDWLADVALKQGNVTDARVWMEEGLQVAQKSGDRCRTAFCMRSLARLEYSQGNGAEAHHWASEALSMFAQLGMISEAQETTDLLHSMDLSVP